MKHILFSLILFSVVFSSNHTFSQDNKGIKIKQGFRHAPFPDKKRAAGHDYDGKTYSFEEHYNDSSVFIYVPEKFDPAKSTDFVVYFHGWYNNIDSALVQFGLLEQVEASNKNFIFVFPEGPKNAPDSYGGKLEDTDQFSMLMDEITTLLLEKKIITSNKIGSIILAGHSGAFRVISFILMRGGLSEKIKEVYLFDALYSQLEKYSQWMIKHQGRFINIYTDDGGTKEESEDLMNDLKGWGIPFALVEEKDLQKKDLENKILFIHTDLTHNGVIYQRHQFEKFLNSSGLYKFKD